MEHFLSTCNSEMVAQLQRMKAAGQLEGLGVTARLSAALRLRLSMIGPHMANWPQVGCLLGVSIPWQHLGKAAPL